VTDFVMILTTFPADKDPGLLAKALVEERLAACVNILPPMRSIYRWKGVTEQAEEHQLVIKTTSDRVQELETRLRAMHPYDVPEFLVLPVLDGGRDYLAWLRENTRSP
jgi:periplasmic divalent cation tolerance protein